MGEDIPTPAPLGTRGLDRPGRHQTQCLILRAVSQRNVRRANHDHHRPASCLAPPLLPDVLVLRIKQMIH